MAIPECNDGKILRGGDGGIVSCRDGICNGGAYLFRGCSDSPMMKMYEKHDIVMANEETSCRDILKDQSIFDILSHDTVIVGHGASTIYEFWLVK